MTSLQQVQPITRIIFLKKFTEELLRNSIEKEELLKKIETEKLKHKFIQPHLTPEQAFEKIIQTPNKRKIAAFDNSFTPPKPTLRNLHRKSMITQKVEGALSTKLGKPLPKHLHLRKPLQSNRTFPPGMKKSMQMYSPSEIQTPTRTEVLKTIQPVAQPKPKGFNLGNLEVLLNDPTVQSIECSGPGKNIIIKKRNRMTTTKLMLNENEINILINNFSKESKIPVLGGILKAAVGNLVISAIISEFVGSRFIINRIISYSKVQK